MIYHGDCINIMKKLKENSIDSIVTDSPYGLGFMGKDWDKFDPKGFQDFSYKWGTQALKILKPGAYLANFSGTRTYHRMVCGLEDAGFVIKDCLSWLYGSGFPKSYDISAGIDDFYGLEREKKKIKSSEVANFKNRDDLRPFIKEAKEKGFHEIQDGIPISPEAIKWNGWGTGLKPAYEPIVLAQKPYEKTYVNNTLKYGVGGLNLDGCRVDFVPTKETDARIYDKEKNITRGCHTNATVKIAPDGNDLPMYNSQKGRHPANLLLSHHPECKVIGTKIIKNEHREKAFKAADLAFGTHEHLKNDPIFMDQIVKDYQCHPSCPVRLLDGQSRYFKTFDGKTRFIYTGKAYKTERNLGLEGVKEERGGKFGFRDSKGFERFDTLPQKNDIATLKPINVMRYLVRLITPPNGTVLDPFAGSGTTGIACILEGFKYILIEKRERFAKIIIPKRLKFWKDPSNWEKLKDHNALPKLKIIKEKKTIRSLDSFIKKR